MAIPELNGAFFLMYCVTLQNDVTLANDVLLSLGNNNTLARLEVVSYVSWSC